MIYDLSKNIDRNKANEYFKYLLEKNSLISLSKKRKKRTVQQNRYLHILFALFGINFGYSIDEAKTLIKRSLGYHYKKKDSYFLMKTSKMNTKELTIFIEKFRNYSAKNGYYLPSAEEYLTNYAEFERQIANNEIYL